MPVIAASFSTLDTLNIGEAVTIHIVYDATADGTTLYLGDDGVGTDETQQYGTFDTGTEISFAPHDLQAVDVVYTVTGYGFPFIGIQDDVGNFAMWTDGSGGNIAVAQPPSPAPPRAGLSLGLGLGF